MNQQKQSKPVATSQPSAPVKYPELSDAELEVVCGGGNIFRK